MENLHYQEVSKRVQEGAQLSSETQQDATVREDIQGRGARCAACVSSATTDLYAVIGHSAGAFVTAFANKRACPAARLPGREGTESESQTRPTQRRLWAVQLVVLRIAGA